MRLLLLALTLLSACATATPGTVLLSVNKAANDDNRYSVIHGGWVCDICRPTVDFYSIPTTEQRVVWAASENEGGKRDESITFNGKDGQPVNVDMAIGYQVSTDDDLIVKLVQTYGLDISSTIHGRVRDSVRSQMNTCAGHMSVEDIYGEKKAELIQCVHDAVSAEYAPNGLVVTRLTLNSEIRLPQAVKEAMTSATAATQNATRVQNEVALTRAEGEKRVTAAQAEAEAILTKAKAEAEANRVISASLSPELIELRRIEVQRAQAEKWNGQLPSTVMGGEVPMLYEWKQ